MNASKASDIHDLISRDSLEADSQRRLLEAEFLHRSHQLRSFDRFKHALSREGEDHAAVFKRLTAVRDELAERLRRDGTGLTDPPAIGFVQSKLASSPVPLVTPRLGFPGEGPFVFGSEGCVALADPSDGVDVVPGTSGTHGRIETTALGPFGGVSFRGLNEPSSFEHPALGADGDFDFEQVWLHNWRHVVLFPCVSTRSYLTYRFDISVLASLFTEGEGMVMGFASVGEEPNASPSSQIVVDTPVGWPMIADLTESGPAYNGHYGELYGSLNVERTFEVPAGRTPGVAIVFGFVVRLLGHLRLTFRQDSGIGFTDGKVCYTYTPVPILVQA